MIIGDANLAELAIYLKVGTTALVLAMIEDGWPLPDVGLAHPVGAVHTISHDPTLAATVPLADGRALRGVDVQRAYAEAAAAYRRRSSTAPTSTTPPPTCSPSGSTSSTRWNGIRWSWPTGSTGRRNCACWKGSGPATTWRGRAPRLALVDLQYADVRLDKGLYNRLVSRGSMRRLVTEDAVRRAMTEPPEDTRAYFRGRCVAKYADRLAAASWDSVIFDVGRESLVRIPTMEPTRGTKEAIGALLDASDDAAELVDALTRRPGAGG